VLEFRSYKFESLEGKQMNEAPKCGCGRSPTGNCIGWHELTEEEFQKKLAIYKENNKSKEETAVND
jgi:hypothetical protein|tara:strand:- start:358 stop:555 length:198 start_codon:yes stop_codon:yes gene_type:complete